MIKSYLKRTIIFVLILFHIQTSIQDDDAVFTVEKLDTSSYECRKSQARFTFDILGKWNHLPLFGATLNFHTISGNKKSFAECFIWDKGVLSCHTQISYPLRNTYILLPVKTPKTEGYTIKNWEKIIGSEPSISNAIEVKTCEPEAGNIFEPTNITIGDCQSGSNIRKIKISGKWADNNNTLYPNCIVHISLDDNSDGDFAKCVSRDTPGFDCNYTGKGRIKINEQYVTDIIWSFKMKELDSGQSVSSCSSDDDDDDELEILSQFLSADSLYFLNKMLILFSFLLF